MKPEKLKLRGFITYRDEVNIDFRAFDSDKIFMICGPTGSGKTSLFDAICFALYGQVSTDVRGSDESLRCDFLNPGDPETYVEFTFASGGHEYRVVRYPSQYRQRRTGSITKESSKAELYKDGVYMDLGKVSEVTEEIVKILGLTRDQFTKIVMLPQGEFARFLASPSKEKEGILRKIFGTGQYEAFGLAARRKKDDSEKALNHLRMGGDRVLMGLDEETKVAVGSLLSADGTADPGSYPAVTQILGQEKEKARLGEVGLRETLEELQKDLEQHQQAWIVASQLDKERKELQRVELELEESGKRQQEEEEQKKQIAFSKIAMGLKPLEDAWRRSLENVKRLESQIQQEEGKRRLLEENVKAWEEKEKSLPESRKKLDQLKEQGILLKEEQKVFQEMKNRLEEQKRVLSKLQKAEETLKKHQEEKTLTAAKREDLNKVEEEERLLQKRQQKVDRQFLDLQLYENKLQILEGIFCKQGALKRLIEEEQEHLQKALEEEKSLRTLVQTQEEQLKKQGLYLYARQLKEGEPCPLCGSPHHPAPVTAGEEAGEGVEEKDLEDNRQKLIQISSLARSASDLLLRKEKEIIQLEEELRRNLETNQGIFQEPEIPLQNPEGVFQGAMPGELEPYFQSTPEEKASSVTGEVPLLQKILSIKELEFAQTVLSSRQKSLKEERQELIQREKDLQEKRRYRQILEEQGKKLEEKIKTLELEENTLRSQKENLGLRLAEDEKKVTSFTHAEEGEEKLLQLRRDYTRLDKEMQEIAAEAEAYRTKLAQNQTALANYRQSHFEEEKRCAMEREEFETNREKNFASLEAYEKSRDEAKELLLREEENQKFFRELEKKHQLRQLLTAKLAGRELQDPQKMQEHIQQIRDRQRQEQISREALQLRCSHLEDWIRQMEGFSGEIQGVLDQRQTAAELYALCRGDNARSLSFETYVLLWYFDDVLDYANRRLHKISSGQYEIHRRQENQKERGQNKGLEIAVLDTNTGKERSSSTLSGGESFLVSLSLALGLSDAMMGAAGGVEVGALFIDEGFGTLDQDRLQSAVDCLVQLTGANRLIGIISHVEELKESIPGKIMVSYHKDRGSQVKVEG